MVTLDKSAKFKEQKVKESRIVIDTYNVTALTSTLILLGSTILLLVIECRYFKKKI